MVALEHQWDLAALYADVADFNAAKDAFVKDAKDIAKWKGRLGESAQTLRASLDHYWELEERIRRLESYAGRLSDQDTRVQANKALQSEVSQARSRFAEASAYLDPELVAIPEATIEAYFASEPGLAVYERPIRETLRRKKHILSPAEERILAAASDVARAGSSLYSIFENADLPRETIALADGTNVKLTDANYGKYRRAPLEADRDRLAESFFAQFKKFEQTIGEMLYTQLKVHRFYAEMRGYESTLAASLDYDDIDPAIYRSLIAAANQHLPTFHRYLNLKRRALGLPVLEYQDLYVPFVAESKIEMDWAEAARVLPESLSPMGEEYVALIRRSLAERWIDVYPTEGKRSGAYSSGWAYGVHPYVLMNYNDEYSDVLTLAHELGHALHSWNSNETQPIATADYSTFVAEVASTFNENLLNDYMLKKVQSDDERVYLLGNFLDGTIKGTFFRQIQFAEYELLVHEAVEKGEALTGETLSKMYIDLVRRYYGDADGVCKVPQFYESEWSYIPHFYYNYYVFQYSTSVAAASALSQKVIDGEPGALERYAALLRSGGSKDPVSLLKDAGVDMTKPDAYAALMDRANRYMDELEKILDKQGK